MYHLNRTVGAQNGVTLQDVLCGGKEDVERVFLSTFAIDLEWLLDEVPRLTRVPTCIVADRQRLPKVPEGFFPDYWNILRPTISIPYGMHHAKVIMCVHGEGRRLRVAVCTANLIAKDWNRKTNGVWMQDFDRKATDAGESTDFEVILIDYLQHVGANEWATRASAYDFSPATAHLILSVPGYHRGGIASYYGHMRVRRLLERAGTRAGTVAAQVSSVGSLTPKWLHEEFAESLRASPPLQVVWPTREFVRTCIDGNAAGSSLCMPKKNNKPFLSALYHRYVPALPDRERVPPHIKTYAQWDDDDDDDDGRLRYIILTSANLSTAAWGSLQKKGEQLMIRHYEMGVLLLDPNADALHFMRGQPYESDEPWTW